MEKWARANYTPCLPLGDNRSLITGSEAHIQLARKAAAEGIVLLKNKNNLLPFAKGTKVAIFGCGQIDYVKGGGGSGVVHALYTRNIYQGLKLKADHVEVFDALSLYYQNYVEEQYKNGAKIGLFEEPEVPNTLLLQAKDFANTAIIVIRRYSSEASDRKNDGTDDYFYLSDAEKAMLEAVTDSFENVVVLLNVGAMIDTTWFAYNDAVSSAVMLWQGGMEGGLAAADVLVGEVTPSGKLVDTCAKTFDDYPSSEGFHESADYVKYTEDIFVGYRYFETVPGKKECVVYPFGYGLSYTTFALSKVAACQNADRIIVSVTVTNTGRISGKEVVQVYFSAPSGKLDKPARELCGFAKTKELVPGESEELYISFAINDMASLDDCGMISKSAYVLEKGEYHIYVGTDIRSAKEIDYTYVLEVDTIIEQLHPYMTPERLDKRMKADGTYEILECKPVERAVFDWGYKCADKPERMYRLVDVAEGKADLDTFIAQLTDEELIHLLGGQPNHGVAGTSGMGSLEKYGIPPVMTTDGPAGVRVNPRKGVYATAFPVATALACSWNLELLEEIGRAGALETKENNMQIWLTPALNIHRSPLCGRNFEYYSEDPFLSGKMAAAMVNGIQSQNIVAVPKHFACNNKETNRKNSDSIVSERALREIYLKGFEICVKEAKPKMIMTAYNLINGVRASENAEMLDGILRSEWGYKGMVTTDWLTLGEHWKEAKAGNDIKMPRGNNDNLREALEEGTLSREELCVCAKRILEMILWLE
ncbi:MAG: glycoside hydrolase family 3 C-terminal domain-containing protein [Tyzzerella sp.]|nr:glycoside hydrolase family 3 C-terminal domain-containing protein [Tyzzerella sp.]